MTKKIYSAKAEADFGLFKPCIENACNVAGVVVSEDTVRTFLKNWQCPNAMNYRSLQDERQNPNSAVWQYSEGAAKIWYVIWRGTDRFIEQNGRSPFPADFVSLQKLCTEVLHESGVTAFGNDDLDKYVKEMCRYEGGQLVGTCGFLGGVVSVEIIKHLVRQFVPFNNCLVFDGVKTEFNTFEV